MTKKKIIDLTLPLQDGMMTYPTPSHHKFESSILGRIEIEGRETRKFTMGSHCGTHVDAMRHFLKDGATIDQFPMDALIGDAKVINLGVLDPGSIIEKEHLKPFLCEKIRRLVLRADWCRFWGTSQYYKDWPYLSKEAILLLINHGIELLALDFPSPDSAYFGNDCSLDSPNHKLLFENNVILVEYLTNIKSLSSNNIYLIVSPLKLVGFDGAPARVTAYSTDS